MKTALLELRPQPAKDGTLVALETGQELPFPVVRAYYLFAGNAAQVHGHHAHRRGEQVIVCLRGWCRLTLEDGHGCQEFVLDRPDRALHLGPLVWEEIEMSADALLLSLCDTPYDPADQIESKKEFLALAGGVVGQESQVATAAPVAVAGASPAALSGAESDR